MLGSNGSNGSTPLQRVRSAFPGAEAVGELVAAGYVSVLDTIAALVWCALLQVVVRGQSAPACWTLRRLCTVSCKPDGSWDEHSAGGTRYASVLDMVVIIVTSANASDAT